jgi:hypothetical protein
MTSSGNDEENVSIYLFFLSIVQVFDATHLLQRPTTSGFSQSSPAFLLDAVLCRSSDSGREGTSERRQIHGSGNRDERTVNHEITL